MRPETECPEPPESLRQKTESPKINRGKRLVAGPLETEHDGEKRSDSAGRMDANAGAVPENRLGAEVAVR